MNSSITWLDVLVVLGLLIAIIVATELVVKVIAFLIRKFKSCRKMNKLNREIEGK